MRNSPLKGLILGTYAAWRTRKQKKEGKDYFIPDWKKKSKFSWKEYKPKK